MQGVSESEEALEGGRVPKDSLKEPDRDSLGREINTVIISAVGNRKINQILDDTFK